MTRAAAWTAAVTVMLVVLIFPQTQAQAGAGNEGLYTICFPTNETKIMKAEECRSEDCGLVDVAVESTPPADTRPRYFFLGGTELGFLWGTNYIRTIGPERVRFLLYVIAPLTGTVLREDPATAKVTERIIRSEFFASFVEYRDRTAPASRAGERRMERKEEVVGSSGDFQMIDLHCSARKMKIYDNQTLYYRTIGSGMQDVRCAELLWEKPDEPLSWQAASSLTMDILTSRYCRGAHPPPAGKGGGPAR